MKDTLIYDQPVTIPAELLQYVDTGQIRNTLGNLGKELASAYNAALDAAMDAGVPVSGGYIEFGDGPRCLSCGYLLNDVWDGDAPRCHHCSARDAGLALSDLLDTGHHLSFSRASEGTVFVTAKSRDGKAEHSAGRTPAEALQRLTALPY